MPAKSKAQRRLFGMCSHSEHPPASCPDMPKAKMKEFASTKEDKLPFRLTKSAEKGLRDGYRSK